MNVTDPAFHLISPASPIYQITNAQGNSHGPSTGGDGVLAIYAILFALIIVGLCLILAHVSGDSE